MLVEEGELYTSERGGENTYYEDYSMVTPWEKTVGKISEKLRQWTAKNASVTSAGAVGETFVEFENRIVRSCTLKLFGGDQSHRMIYFSSSETPPWPWPIEPPPRNNDKDAGRELAHTACCGRFLHDDDEDADCDDETTRLAMKTLFGVDTFVLLVAEQGGGAAEWRRSRSSSDRERACALASGLSVACLDDRPCSVPVFAKVGSWVRGSIISYGCSTEFEAFSEPGGQAREEEPLRLPKIIEELKKRVPFLRIDDAVVLVKFAWTKHSFVRREIERKSAVVDSLEALELRRRRPLWGPRDPNGTLNSVRVVAKWRERPVAGALDEPNAPFSTFEPAEADEFDVVAGLARRTDDDTPLADHLRALGAALLVDFPVDAVLDSPLFTSLADNVNRHLLKMREPSSTSLAQQAKNLRDRSATLSQKRLAAFIDDIFRDCDGGAYDDDINSTEISWQLSLRLGALSSLQAMALLWRSFARTYRGLWEESKDPPDRWSRRFVNDMDTAAEKNGATAPPVYVGRKRVEGRAALAVKRCYEQNGGALSRLIRLLDASILVSNFPEEDDDRRGYQAPPPPFGVEDPLKDPRRRSLALLASDAAICKRDIDFEDFVSSPPRPNLYELEDDVVDEIWDAVRPTMARDARPFFKIENEAEHALHRLEVAHPSWVLSQALRCACRAAAFVLRAECSQDLLAMPSVRGALNAAESAMDVALRDLPDDDDTTKSVRELPQDFWPKLAAAVDAVGAAETHLARASSILRCSNLSSDLAERLLRGTPVRLETSADRSRIASLLSQGGELDQADTFPDPEVRDYLVVCEASPDDHQDDQVKLPHRVYARSEKGQNQPVFAFAVSDPDGLPSS